VISLNWVLPQDLSTVVPRRGGRRVTAPKLPNDGDLDLNIRDIVELGYVTRSVHCGFFFVAEDFALSDAHYG
jgi:hypothetical protein